MTIIKDGTGTGKTARIDNTNKMDVHSVTYTEAVEAAENGDAYNINTGTIALTTSTASGVIYLKNNEDRDLVIDSIEVGIGSAGTVTDSSIVTLIRNPTTGTLISNANAVDMNENRNFGSSKTLIADVYKGAEGNTVTDGDNFAQFYVGAGSRLFAPTDLIIPKGSSIAITIDTNTSSGTTNVYAVFICHLKRSD